MGAEHTFQPPGGAQIEPFLVQVCLLHRERSHQLFEALGLYHGQPRLLGRLWNREGQTHSELAASLHIQPATVSRMIRRMERAGFVVRRTDPADERVSRVYLTDRGRAIRSEIERAWRSLEKRALSGLSGGEKRLFYSLLERVRDNLLSETKGGKSTGGAS
jgi:DNA-binding MarR family transcriptional regulator